MNKQLPIYFDTFNFQANSNLHDHNTRTGHKVHITRVNHAFATTNLRHNIIQTVNNTPENVIEKVFTYSINGMTTYAKNTLLEIMKPLVLLQIATYVNCKLSPQ